MTNEWLKQLRPGDTVAVYGGLGGRDIWLAKVNRLTPSGRIVIHRNGQDTVYNPDGWERGIHAYHREHLAEPASEIREKIEFKRLCSHFRGTSPEKLTLDQLRRIDAIIKEQKS
ncbi:hypothetical protein M0R72_19235 [Candidatus Pacearchaeota archaeon]|jgi:hypothetical protein|nr:hypothetical protein [Candidatus Pacearchaeota archaeon]